MPSPPPAVQVRANIYIHIYIYIYITRTQTHSHTHTLHIISSSAVSIIFITLHVERLKVKIAKIAIANVPAPMKNLQEQGRWGRLKVKIAKIAKPSPGQVPQGGVGRRAANTCKFPDLLPRHGQLRHSADRRNPSCPHVPRRYLLPRA